MGHRLESARSELEIRRDWGDSIAVVNEMDGSFTLEDNEAFLTFLEEREESVDEVGSGSN